VQFSFGRIFILHVNIKIMEIHNTTILMINFNNKMVTCEKEATLLRLLIT